MLIILPWTTLNFWLNSEQTYIIKHHAYTHVHIHSHIHMCMCTHTNTCVNVYFHTLTHTQSHTHSHIYMCTHSHTHAHTYTCAHTHTYILSHTFTYIHVHTHTCANTHWCTLTHTHIHHSYTCIHTYTLCTHSHIHTYTCAHAHACTHTHTHPHSHIYTLTHRWGEEISFCCEHCGKTQNNRNWKEKHRQAHRPTFGLTPAVSRMSFLPHSSHSLSSPISSFFPICYLTQVSIADVPKLMLPNPNGRPTVAGCRGRLWSWTLQGTILSHQP